MIIGSKYGRLTVLGESAYRPKGQRIKYYECLCKCGINTLVMGTRLTNGETKSCGCYRKEVAAAKALKQKGLPNIKNRKRPYEWLYNTFKPHALERFGSVISYEEFLEFVKITECHYCNSKIIWPPPHKSEKGPENCNLDRTDNNKGYEKSNIVVCCWKCNQSKRHFYTYAEWKAMTAALRIYHET